MRRLEVGESQTRHTRWLVLCHSSRCQATLGRVCCLSLFTQPSRQLASSQLREPLEFVADHEAVTLLLLTACHRTDCVPEDVEHLLTINLSTNFFCFTQVYVFSMWSSHSRGASKILFLPLLLDKGVTCSIPRGLLSNFFVVSSL